MIQGFILITKYGNVLHFNHCFSGNCIQVKVSDKHAKKFHIGKRYELHVRSSNMQLMEEKKAAA
jgi:hypothetical protein